MALALVNATVWATDTHGNITEFPAFIYAEEISEAFDYAARYAKAPHRIMADLAYADNLKAAAEILWTETGRVFHLVAPPNRQQAGSIVESSDHVSALMEEN